MNLKNNNCFDAYIKGIASGACLASTKHDAVLEGSTSFGTRNLQLWENLKSSVGEEIAKQAVKEWIEKPYNLRKSV